MQIHIKTWSYQTWYYISVETEQLHYCQLPVKQHYKTELLQCMLSYTPVLATVTTPPTHQLHRHFTYTYPPTHTWVAALFPCAFTHPPTHELDMLQFSIKTWIALQMHTNYISYTPVSTTVTTPPQHQLHPHLTYCYPPTNTCVASLFPYAFTHPPKHELAMLPEKINQLR